MAAHAAPGRARRSWRARRRLAAGVAIVAPLIAALAWLAAGGRWYVVATPSMGTDAPVGTLLWVRPVDPATLAVGDFITFRPPHSAKTFSHRIVEITAAGIRTKGTLTATDPWTLRPRDVVGRVVVRWWGVGWFIHAVPILAIGALLTWLVRRRVRGDWRIGTCAIGSAVSVCVVLVTQRPLTGALLLATQSDPLGARATYVSTGLLPIKLSAAGSRSVELTPGSSGTIVSGPSRHLAVSAVPAVPWWLWTIVFGFALAPGLWSACARRYVNGPR